MTYRIISTLDGSTETCSLSELSQQLKLNCILAELNSDGSLIDSWPLVHETLVTFAVEFADYALLNYAEQKLPEAERCITLSRKWLQNHDSVSVEELKSAAHAAHAAAAARAAAHAAYAASDAAHAAADAAYAAAAANAAANAARATYAAANAAAAAAIAAANAAYANAAERAAYAANAANADAAGKNREAELIRQGQFIVEYMRAV